MGDGTDDFAVANYNDGTIYIFTNDGTKGFNSAISITVGFQPWALDPEDLDDDEETDLVAACQGSSSGGSDGEVFIVFNQGGTWPVSDPIVVGEKPWSVAVADFDNNGSVDIVTTNFDDDTISLLLNDAGVFRPVVNLPVGGSPRSIARINLEGDGDEDLALVSNDEFGDPVVQVLRNDLNGGTQLIFADADSYDVGGNLLFVRADDVDQDLTEDIVVVDDGPAGSKNRSGGDDRGEGNFRGRGGEVNVLLNDSGSATTCPWDITGGGGDPDGAVNLDDLLALLANWGGCPIPPAECPWDFTGGGGDPDGNVNLDDLLALLANWGPCP